jgi:DNA-directed RNA polymerase alpha subunit
VGEILEMKKPDLLQIRNFGEKSMGELFDRLREMDLLPPEFDPDIQQEDDGEEEDTEGDLVEVGAEADEAEGQDE